MNPKVSLKTVKADYLESFGPFKEPHKCCLVYIVSRFWNTASRSHTYQIQHCFHYVSIADLADLNETGEHCEFRLDIPDRNRGVYHPGRQHHRAGARHHHHHHVTGTGARGDGGGGVMPVAGMRCSIARRGHRLNARHILWAAVVKTSGVPSRPGCIWVKSSSLMYLEPL